MLVTFKNGVTTLTMNRPEKLNGWTRPMMNAIQSEFLRLAKDDATKVKITQPCSSSCATVTPEYATSVRAQSVRVLF